MFVADFQLGFGADHTFGQDAADTGGFEFLPASGMHIAEAGAGAGEADFLAGGHIGGAADHLHSGGAGAVVHFAEGQRIRVGMRPGGADGADHAAVPAAADDDVAHLNAGHRQPMGQFRRRQGDVNIFGKPGEWNQHRGSRGEIQEMSGQPGIGAVLGGDDGDVRRGVTAAGERRPAPSKPPAGMDR